MRLAKLITIFALLTALFACTSNYKKGEKEFYLRKYIEAKKYYRVVEQNDLNYANAQARIHEIDSILDQKLFDKAMNLYTGNMFSDARTVFLTIDSSSVLYNQINLFLNKIDSIDLVRQREAQAKADEANVVQKRNAKLKEADNAKVIRDLKKEVRRLFNELLSFKNKNDFHVYGFGTGGSYNKWLQEVKTLKNTPEAALLIHYDFVVGDLETLGLEYMGTKGKETEYTRWAKKTINDGLKKNAPISGVSP